MSTAIAQQLALVFMGRSLDTQWASSTANLLNGGQPSVALQTAFYNSAVAEGVFSTSDSPSGLVNDIFQNIFGFGASTFEQTAWGNLITNGTLTKETAAWTIFKSYLGATNVPDAYKLPAQSKLVAMNAYSTELAADAEANLALAGGGKAAAAARAYVSGVTSQATAATAISGVAASVDALPTASAPTYTLTSSAASVNEGGAINFTLAATNVAAGTQQAYTITGVNSADVVGGSLSGVATIGADGKATISVTLAADATTEGAETLTVSVAGKTASATVNDTSIAPVPTYALAADAASVNEGGTATFTLTTTNVAAGSTFDYTLSGVSAADVVGGALTGTATVGNDGKAVVQVTLAADATTEGAETMTLAVAGQSASTVVNDTSTLNTTLTTAIDNIVGTASDDIVTGVIDFAGGVRAGAGTTLNSADTIAAGAGTADTLSVSLVNASGAAVGSATAAVAQVNTITFANAPAAATDIITVSLGGASTTVVTGANVTSVALAVANALNALAGATIAVPVAGVITVTAPVAGTALPTIGFSGSTAAATLPTNILTTPNTAASGGVVSLGTLSGFEVLDIQNVSGSAVTISAGQAAGHTSFVADRSTSALTVTDLASGAGVGITGNGASTLGALTTSYTAAATAAGNLSVTNGVNSGLVTFNTPAAVATVNVLSSGGAQAASGGQVNTLGGLTLSATVNTLAINAATSLTTGTITGAALTSVTATGLATTVNISTAPATVTSIDGSNLTAGGVSATLTGAVTSFKGGAGADTVTTAATTAATALIDGGAGTADILVLAGTNDVTTSAKAAQYANFEILRNSTTGNVDASLFSAFTSVQANANGAGFLKMTATQANAVTSRVSGGTNTNATFSLADSSGTSDVLKVTLNNSTTTTGPLLAQNLTGATINGFETLNLVSTSGTNGAVSNVSFTSATELTALTITGVAPISLSTTNIVKAVTIDASAMSFVPTVGNNTFAVSGNLVKGSTVTATANADGITTTAAIAGSTGDFVTYNAGAGNDTISSTVAAINNTSAANGSLRIDGGAGTDTLTLTDAALTAVDANFQFITGIEGVSYTVANSAISFTSGGFFDTNFKAAGVTLTLGDATNAQVNTVNLQTFTGNATVALTATAATTQAQTITTGSGADAVTLLAAGTTTGTHTISTGAGNDAINVTIAGATIIAGTVTINGGAGQDTIIITGNSTANANTASNVNIVVNEGASTLAASDVVNGFVINTAAEQATLLNFDGTAVAAADVTSTVATGFTNVNYAITAGLLSFTGTGASGLNAAQKATIAQTYVTADEASVIFTDGSDTYAFHNGVLIDDLVRLVGVTGTAIDAVGIFTAGGITFA